MTYLNMIVQVGDGRGPYENLRDYSVVYGVSDHPEEKLAEMAADHARTTVEWALRNKDKWPAPMDRFGALSETLNCPRELVVRIARALGHDTGATECLDLESLPRDGLCVRADGFQIVLRAPT